MTRTLSAIPGNSQRLDGGAMFGNVPKALWSRWITPDAENRIPLACRAMLIHDGARTILCETGIGAFFAPKMKDRFGVVEDEHVLLRELESIGCPQESIDIVVLSHLHFDHAGGLLTPFAEGAPPRLLFPKAKFLVSQGAWDRARNPHPRDRASFIDALPPLLEESGRLELVTGATSPVLGEGFRFHLSEGHTPGLLLLEADMPEGPVLFAGDLIPGRAWVHAPITMGYDRFPERLIDEKVALLGDLAQRRGRLFFTHDAEVAMARVTVDERGRFTTTDEVAHPRRTP
ncbi:MAG: MBL fold metallo-hydrolase [Myxococcales bacterium]|nr:MBL fold metallo-hydrolase [Myxococcales bacterium]